MTIFDCLNAILFDKDKSNFYAEESDFNMFMVNRWITMYSPDMAKIINETSNKYIQTLTTKEAQFEFLFNLIPKLKRKHLSYIKRKKETSSNDEDINYVEMIANKLEISQREVKNYMDNLEQSNQ
jgi:hypothetical protein